VLPGAPSLPRGSRYRARLRSAGKQLIAEPL
jgi:hypothetical protein